jgi:hypothetical protein
MEKEKNLKREKYDLGVIWRKMCHRLKIGLLHVRRNYLSGGGDFLGGGFIFPTGAEEILSTSL